ncbi:MAG: hypothetical protein P1P84_12775 [Deferrisomatales bacterium]|nr:hypothetical protein [Deferrisomatales bacterium]
MHIKPTEPEMSRQEELLRLWRWRGSVTLFWLLFALGLLPAYFLFSTWVAVGVWCLLFSLPLFLTLVVLRLAECPGCNRRLSGANPLPGLLARTCPHCGLPLSPGGTQPPVP